jgi:ribosomal protein S18 acetylase RimI-like enzyme
VSLNAIQGHLRASIAGRAQRVGPFLITFEPDTASPGRNYAIPDDGAMPGATEIADLVARFAALGRTPRLEYVNPVPAVDAALSAVGFTVENRYPLMTIARGDLVEPVMPDGLEVVLATSDEQLRRAATVQNAAYGEGEATGHDVARLRGTVDGGGAVALALLDGEPVGSGLFTVPHDTLTEVAAVGVAERYRRRGIAAAVAYRLTRAAFDAGAVPYLQAEGDPEQRIYGRIGYCRVGSLTAISLHR